ncbi:asparaginase domain-containing protein, partial [Acinetobacter indicus]|uniref:asparaginase domain-containing protein n=1 Tax=Acinetobacter indicus TaxID=756892 RepID=UPI00148A3275
MMKKIAIIYIGGTFSCVGEPLSSMSSEQSLLQLRHVLPLHLLVECFVATVIQDSSCCTATAWLRLVQFIQQQPFQQMQHLVVMHGTDTSTYPSGVPAPIIAQPAHLVLTATHSPLLTVDRQNTTVYRHALLSV